MVLIQSDTRKQMKGRKHQSTAGTEGSKNVEFSEAAGGISKDSGVKGSQGDVKNILNGNWSHKAMLHSIADSKSPYSVTIWHRSWKGS
jgi:hypothetical protein